MCPIITVPAYLTLDLIKGDCLNHLLLNGNLIRELYWDFIENPLAEEDELNFTTFKDLCENCGCEGVIFGFDHQYLCVNLTRLPILKSFTSIRGQLVQTSENEILPPRGFVQIAHFDPTRSCPVIITYDSVKEVIIQTIGPSSSAPRSQLRS